jgi:hypothetical protein
MPRISTKKSMKVAAHHQTQRANPRERVWHLTRDITVLRARFNIWPVRHVWFWLLSVDCWVAPSEAYLADLIVATLSRLDQFRHASLVVHGYGPARVAGTGDPWIGWGWVGEWWGLSPSACACQLVALGLAIDGCIEAWEMRLARLAGQRPALVSAIPRQR